MDRIIEYKYEVAVLIPHYNNLPGLAKSLESIKYLGSVLICIVDDGSTSEQKPNKTKLSKYTDHTIEIIEIEINTGIEEALNIGLKFLKDNKLAALVARLDCGDTMTKNRLSTQIAFMKTNEDIYLIGSWVDFIHNEKTLYTLKLPQTHVEIAKKMNYKVCFIHPSVLFRMAALETIGYYPVDYPAAEDYAYFMKFVKHYKTANINEVLTVVEKNTEGISSSRRHIQLKSRLRVVMQNFRWDIYTLAGISKILLLLVLPYSIIMLIKTKIYQ